jgi:hypothetical protein
MLYIMIWVQITCNAPAAETSAMLTKHGGGFGKHVDYVFGSAFASAFAFGYFSKVLLAWKNIKLILFFVRFMMVLICLCQKWNKNLKKFILMYFQVKSYFKKHSAPQSQTHTEVDISLACQLCW